MISEKVLSSYQSNGYVIIKNFLSDEKINDLTSNYNTLRKRLARKASIKFEDYENEIFQIRDLWKFNESFKNLILEMEISQLAPLFFTNDSCRLLHDHVINKPLGRNGIIPWHQDYTYWPVDNSNGLSFWLPFNDLDAYSGVLEVISGSHLWGEERPMDFMNDNKSFDENRTEKLAVNKGDLVILHSLTWHRTTENTSIDERIAYITLWIPTDSKYTPKHASWHPVNDNISVAEGEILNDDWFPIIGDKISSNNQVEYRNNDHTEDMSMITMFNASKIARNFLTKELQFEGNIWGHLYNTDNRQDAVNVLTQKYSLDCREKSVLDDILLSMAINGLAYQDHRARNVYNESYLKFKSLFGNDLQS
ncbi:phytanoyl-CoA dioxygenase family protein [bacterium]|nr:phytanoyl-CoA dioxygenase family protein [Crocinitomicaceae bacterium]MDA9020492.1 phytanoyl-CoA dioxygenase family protein [bacterium]MDC0459621.1 phytanoyl-CoA dioxygenase family protein [Crocinitomicaceae bacterium]